jgi:hypothetical protein
MTISPMGYAVTGLPDRYAFELLISSRSIISVRRDVAPSPVCSAEHAATRSQIETSMREIDHTWTWNGRDVPRVKPLYTEIDIGQDGRIWLARDITPLPQPRTPATGRVVGRRGRSQSASLTSSMHGDIFAVGSRKRASVCTPLKAGLAHARGSPDFRSSATSISGCGTCMT